jgi:ribonucleotide reductase alpha subunit
MSQTYVCAQTGFIIEIQESRTEEYLTDFAKATLSDRYLVPEDMGSYQRAFARASCAFADNSSHAQRLYDYSSKLWFMFATPLLSNGGTERGLPISCFLNSVDDSREGLGDHYNENIWLTSTGGGIGGYWGNVRSKGTKTSKGSRTTGVIPFMHVADAQMLAFSQGETRRGSYAAYLDVSHPEILEFLSMRKPTGGDIHRKNLNLHNAVCIPDSFMKAVEQGLGWALVDPHTKEVIETVEARDIWTKIIEMRMSTGEPYIFFTDTVNKALPETMRKKGLKVHHSNLCVAPETLLLTKDGYKKIENLEGDLVDAWNGLEWSQVKVKKTGENQELVRVTFSDGSSIDCTPYHKFYVMDTYHGKPKEVRAIDLESGQKLEKFDLPTEQNPNRDASRFVKVTSVEETGRISDTYCATEPKRGRLVFNGILTGNCSEITLPTTPERTAVCCLSSVNLETYPEWKDDRLFIADLIRMLDNTLQVFIDKAPSHLHRAVYSAIQERSIGLGAMGFHALLQKQGIPFESAMAKAWNESIFKSIKERAVRASKELTIARGEAPDMKGTGMRHAHLLAIAPNASSGIICGTTSPSIEPWRANAYVQKTLSGSFVVKNKFLEKLLKEKYGVSDSRMQSLWSDIMVNKGSVQHLDFLDEEDKRVFKTAVEINQEWVIEHAASRQPFVCQSQSVNLFFPPQTSFAELHKVHKMAWTRGLKTLYYMRSEAISRPKDFQPTVKAVDNEEETCLACEG